MTRTEKRKVGDFGELIALKYLLKRGFSALCRNYLRPWGEIDLILKKGNGYHFVEVKTAVVHETLTSDVNHETLRPEDNIHFKKMARMEKAIQTYCLENNIDDEHVYMDALIVSLSPDFKKAKVKYIENIVL